jgi:hypothetical protein
MRMGLEAELGDSPSPLNHPCESRRGERRTAFAGEEEGRAGLLLTLQSP